jgi:hypothetical protein
MIVRPGSSVTLRQMFRSVFLSFVFGAVAVSAAEQRFDFGEVRENAVPAGFRSAVTGRGATGEWKVIMGEVPPVIAPFSTRSTVVPKRHVLAQLSKDPNEARALLFIWEAEPFHDFSVTTRFRIISGEVEQMAGLAVRLQDEKNYYYIRANAKDQNVAFLRYVEGELIGPVSKPAHVKRGEWNQLTVECRGPKLRALLNDQEVIPWTEPSLVPFPDGTSKGVFPSGKIAFWTTADSVVHFVDARVDYTPRELPAQALVRETMLANPRLLGLRIFGLETNGSGTRIIASSDEKEIGTPGGEVERNCIEKGGTYFGRGKELVLVTMPLRDRNGETVGAVRISMTTFFGQTEKNALARAVPVIKSMEQRVTSAKELLQ